MGPLSVIVECVWGAADGAGADGGVEGVWLGVREGRVLAILMALLGLGVMGFLAYTSFAARV